MKYLLLVGLLLLAPTAFATSCVPPVPAGCTTETDYQAMPGYSCDSFSSSQITRCPVRYQQDLQTCRAQITQYQILANAYNLCAARALSGIPDKDCQAELDKKGGHGTSVLLSDGDSCKVSCDTGYYVSVSKTCVPQGISNPAKAEPSPLPAPVVDTTPVPVVVSVPAPQVLNANSPHPLAMPPKVKVETVATTATATPSIEEAEVEVATEPAPSPSLLQRVSGFFRHIFGWD